MNSEKFHDALNYLDDDMIEAAEKLRTKGKTNTIRLRIVSVAAGCFIALLSVIAFCKTQDFYKPETVNPEYDLSFGIVVPEGTVLSGDNIIASSVSGHETADECSSVEYGVGESVMESEEIKERPSVLVKINGWQENGFKATVYEILDTEIFPVGTELTVVFLENISISIFDNGVSRYYKRPPTPLDFPSETVVRVTFDGYDDDTVYAEEIGEADFE